MNPIDIFSKLVTVKDWTNFVIGLAVGVTMVFAGLLGLKTFLNLDVVSKDSYYTRQQVDQGYLQKDVVSQFYLTKAEVASSYVAKTAIASEYMLLSDVTANYVPREGASAVDLAKYIPKSELANYIPRAEVERAYLLKNTCEQQVLLRRRINENLTLKPGEDGTGDKLDLRNLIGFYAEAIFCPARECTPANSYLSVVRSPNKEETLRSTHTERFDVNGRKFTFQVLSATTAGFKISLTEDR